MLLALLFSFRLVRFLKLIALGFEFYEQLRLYQHIIDFSNNSSLIPLVLPQILACSNFLGRNRENMVNQRIKRSSRPHLYCLNV